MFNKLLERQIKRYLKNTEFGTQEFHDLFQAISQAYDHHEEDRQLVERALELSSAELSETNRSLQEANKLIELKNNDLISSLQYAKLVQDSLLARESSIREIFPDSFIFNKPKDIVSGDFFWLYNTNKETYLATVDCTGHGVPGAFMSVISYRFLNQAVRDHGIQKPADILHYLNTEIKATLSTKADDPEAKNALDISLVRMDRRKKVIEFSGVGQKMIISSSGELNEIKGDNYHIGQNLDTSVTPISSRVIEMPSDSVLYMFSDGYVDQFGGPAEKRFGSDRFKKLISSLSPLNFSQQKKRVESTFLEWKNGCEQVDDTLLIGVKVP
ncbi:MAG TPA: SpoIIE family protein phosphatase [Catalimonadaceae bacterium]|nr:SpoIIE family protein phosphatase [Catalimonadaceae bacterium]HPI10231.1 SpoIIE family protein phosphatase [Catalimonadaceae bacterium]